MELHALMFGSNSPFLHLFISIVLFLKHTTYDEVQSFRGIALFPSAKPTQLGSRSLHRLQVVFPLGHMLASYMPI